MCGRYTLARSQQELSERFGIKQLFVDLAPRYNIAPTQKVPVILNIDGERAVQLFQWGLIPSWVKDLKGAKPLINARSETLAEKPSFKNSLVKRRCLIPADGFYEWKKIGTARRPMYIHRADNVLFAMAGIYDEWKNEDGKSLKTFSIITTDANNTMSSVHDRMPVILRPEDEAAWLNPEIKNPAELMPLLKPCADELITMHEVSPRVNTVAEDSPELIEASGTQMRLDLFNL